MKHLCSLLLTVTIAASCGGGQFDQKSYNQIAAEVKAEMNRLSVPCPVAGPVVSVSKPDSVTLELREGGLQLYKKHLLTMDDLQIAIVPNKVTSDGFQFTYETDLVEYALDRKPMTTRDAGTIWLYCDKYKKYNEPKQAPTAPTSKMVTVE